MSSSDVDHYKVLGLNEKVSHNDVRKAYKKLAKEWHPDKNPNLKDSAERKFKEISEAHRVLSDDKLRRDYDRSKENERQYKEFEVRRRKKDNIRRMAKEQEDYVRKQEEKRRKAQRMRAAYADDNGGAEYENTDKQFDDFFGNRERWRNDAPDLYSAESSSSLNHMMKSMMKMTGQMSFGFGFDSGFTDSSNINQAFDRFFAEDPFSNLKV